MYFVTLELTEDGEVKAVARGHGTDVIKEFRKVAEFLLVSRGRWRITYVNGIAPDDEDKPDSEMLWDLTAQAKDRGV